MPAVSFRQSWRWWRAPLPRVRLQGTSACTCAPSAPHASQPAQPEAQLGLLRAAQQLRLAFPPPVPAAVQPRPSAAKPAARVVFLQPWLRDTCALTSLTPLSRVELDKNMPDAGRAKLKFGKASGLKVGGGGQRYWRRRTRHAGPPHRRLQLFLPLRLFNPSLPVCTHFACRSSTLAPLSRLVVVCKSLSAWITTAVGTALLARHAHSLSGTSPPTSAIVQPWRPSVSLPAHRLSGTSWRAPRPPSP